MDLEEFFSSKLRMKILKLFFQLGELNVSEVARRLGINYKTTDRHLKILEKERILKHKMYGRVCLYRLNKNSPKTKLIQELLEVWEKTEKNL